MADERSFHDSSVLLGKMTFLILMFLTFSSLTATLLLLCLQIIFFFRLSRRLPETLLYLPLLSTSAFPGHKARPAHQKALFLTLIQLEERCYLLQPHRFIQRISQKLHYKLFLFQNFSIFSHFLLFLFHFYPVIIPEEVSPVTLYQRKNTPAD